MSENNIFQLSLFEQTSKSIEITEIDGMETGGLLQYFDLKDWGDKVIQTCAGDITVIINALEDYARLLDQAIEEWHIEGYRGAMFEFHAARCRKISAKYQKATGYNYEKAIAKCRKRKENSEDVGEEALTLMAKYGNQKSKSKDNNENDPVVSLNSEAQIEIF
jgi:hypothetical protein